MHFNVKNDSNKNLDSEQREKLCPKQKRPKQTRKKQKK
jgi:hypothetical protein